MTHPNETQLSGNDALVTSSLRSSKRELPSQRGTYYRDILISFQLSDIDGKECSYTWSYQQKRKSHPWKHRRHLEYEVGVSDDVEKKRTKYALVIRNKRLKKQIMSAESGPECRSHFRVEGRIDRYLEVKPVSYSVSHYFISSASTVWIQSLDHLVELIRVSRTWTSWSKARFEALEGD